MVLLRNEHLHGATPLGRKECLVCTEYPYMPVGLNFYQEVYGIVEPRKGSLGIGVTYM